MVVKRVGVWSLGRVSGLIYGVMGLVAGALFSVIAMFGAALGAVEQGGPGAMFLGLFFGIGAVVVLPVFYGLMGLVFGCIAAALYNLIAGFVGGVEVELE